MEGLKNKHVAMAAAVAGALLCLCLVMAWQHFFAPVEVPQDGKYIRERAELEATANQLAIQNELLADSNATLWQLITDMQEIPTEIHRHHEEIRNNNWHLPADSSSALLRTRLAAEDTHRLRFVYRTYTE